MRTFPRFRQLAGPLCALLLALPAGPAGARDLSLRLLQAGSPQHTLNALASFSYEDVIVPVGVSPACYAPTNVVSTNGESLYSVWANPADSGALSGSLRISGGAVLNRMQLVGQEFQPSVSGELRVLRCRRRPRQ